MASRGGRSGCPPGRSSRKGFQALPRERSAASQTGAQRPRGRSAAKARFPPLCPQRGGVRQRRTRRTRPQGVVAGAHRRGDAPETERILGLLPPAAVSCGRGGGPPRLTGRFAQAGRNPHVGGVVIEVTAHPTGAERPRKPDWRLLRCGPRVSPLCKLRAALNCGRRPPPKQVARRAKQR